MKDSTHIGKINIDEFYSGLDSMFAGKNIAETQKYLENWLIHAEELNDIQGIIAVSNELGGLCRAMGNTDRALEEHKKVLTLLEQIGLSETEHYATALINLGDVYIMTGELDRALSAFLNAEDILTSCNLKGDYRMAALNNNISMVYRKLNRFDEAEKSLQKAFLIIKGIPQCRGETATTYVNLGELQVKQGKLIMARENFINAINIFELDGGADVHYSMALAGLGEVCFLNKEYRQAEEYYEKALALTERDFGRTPLYESLRENLELVRRNMQMGGF